MEKSKMFAIEIVNLVKRLELKKEYILSKQILRSGTSIGANVAEANFAQSKADFISKISIAQKEAAETIYWLELLFETKYIENEEFEKLINLNKEILRLLSKILITARINLSKK